MGDIKFFPLWWLNIHTLSTIQLVYVRGNQSEYDNKIK